VELEQVRQQGARKEFAEGAKAAVALNDKLKKALESVGRSESAGAAASDETLTATTQRWSAVHAQMEVDLGSLEKELIAECARRNDDCRSKHHFAMDEVRGKAKRLYAVTQQLDCRLAKQVEDALAAKESGQRLSIQRAAVGVAREHLAFLATNSLVGAIEKSKLPSAKLVQEVRSELEEIVSRLTT
jgi:hypothetical protein